MQTPKTENIIHSVTFLINPCSNKIWKLCNTVNQPTWSEHRLGYSKHRIAAYGSREFCAYGKRVSRVSGEFGLLRVRTQCYVNVTYKASAEIRRLHVSRES